MYGYGNSMFLATHGILARTNAAVLPVNTVAPALSGTAQEGQTLTCSTGTWTGTPTITYTYQWKRNGSNIGSATNSTYTLVTADVGQSIKCTVTATNGAGSVNADSNTVTPTSAVDPDAQAFITAASITNPTQQSAINQLVVDLKGYGVWTKMKALFPFVGGTNSQHTWNLKNTAQFQISWQGGVTSSANGVQFNGMNSYGITGFVPSSNLTLTSGHLSVYVRTNASGGYDMGSVSPSPFPENMLISRYSDNNFYVKYGSTYLTTSNTDSRGSYITNRNSATNTTGFKNGIRVINAVETARLSTLGLFIGANNNGGSASEYSPRQLAFASIGSGLTDTEAANYYTAVQAFQTTLGRQV